MKSALALAAVLAVAAGAPVLAQDAAAPAAAACTAPSAPTLPDAASATMDQMKSTAAAVQGFMKASDSYQECEIKSIEAQRAAAKAAKTKFDENIAKAAQARIGVNQKDKETVGAGWNAAIKAYKTAHPS